MHGLVILDELDVPKTEEGPGFGAAILSMMAYDKNEKTDEYVDIKVKETIKPKCDLAKRYEEKYHKFKKIYPSVKGLYKSLMEE